MGMTIELAIESNKELVEKHREKAKEFRELALFNKEYEKDAKQHIKKAEMYETFVSWMEELLEYRKFGTVKDVEKVMGSKED